MTERHSPFSNQKSALEEYFKSLLDEEQSYEAAADASETPASAETIHETVVSSPVSKTRQTPPSIADMLATVEEADKPQIEYAEPEIGIKIPLPDVAPVTELKTERKTEVITETKNEQVTIAEAAPVTEVVITEPELKVVSSAATKSTVAHETTTPDWAEAPFQCLLFKVGGLSLAVPLVKLNGVIPWSENIVETPNQTEWYLGILMNHGHKVQVIDTAVMVLPEEHRRDLAENPEDRLSHILLVDDQKWGLACDSIGDVVWLKSSDVKWRSNKTKRPWLLGTAIDHMCAVMDTEAFASMLDGKS